MQYIAYPIPSEPEDLIADVISFIQSRFPGWQPYDGNLDTALIEAFAATASDIRELASQVPDTVFRYYGANIIGLTPGDATQATVTATFTARDTAGHLVTAGTRVGIRSSTGDLVPFQVVFDVNIPPGSSATGAGAVSLIAVEPGADGSGLGAPAGALELIDVVDWILSVTQTAVTTGGTDAELDSDYLSRLRSYLTLLAPRPILPADFAILTRQIQGVYRAVAVDGYNPSHNLLTANEASAETDATGWNANFNVTLASSVAQAVDGAKSVSMTAVAANDMESDTQVAAAKPVVPGDVITAILNFRANTTARTVKVGFRWLNAANGTVLFNLEAAGVADSNAGWTTRTFTATAPAGATKVVLVAYVVGAALGEVHYIDKGSLRRNATTDWVAGGTAETGNARMVTVVAVDQNGNAVSTPIKTAIDAYLQARREVNFLIFEADPIYTQIAVTYQVKKLSGFDSADLLTRINAALAAYFNPATWGVPAGEGLQEWSNTPFVRYLEVAQVINSVDGVDYITTTAGNYDLTIGVQGGALARTDVPLGGVASLATAGTMTGVIT